MKNKKNILKGIINILFMVPNIFYYITNLISLISIEARLAGKSFAIILVLCMFFSIVLLSIWGCILVLIFFYSSNYLGPMLSMVLLILINILLLLIIGLIISKLKKLISFPMTREQLSQIFPKRD